MRILERLAILSAMALCAVAGEAAAGGSISFDREFLYEEGQTIAQAYRTWTFSSARNRAPATGTSDSLSTTSTASNSRRSRDETPKRKGENHT